jgi:endo-1,4-beta-D-glucanase Y
MGGTGGSPTGGTGGGNVDAGNQDRPAGERPNTDGASDGRVGDGGSGDGPSASAARPFYSHPMTYPADTIRPNNCVPPANDGGAPDAGATGCPQSTLDQAVASFYDKWKTAYVKGFTSGNCNGMSYIAALPGGDFGNAQTVSHLQGMGMLITVIMAGHDLRAQATFDGLFRYARRYKSSRNAALMASTISGNCPTPSNSAESQTNGDLDIALALLMADRQWGSGGAINYLQEGRAIVSAMKTAEFITVGSDRLPVLGDWVATGQVDGGATADPKFTKGLRSSDLMPGHFRSFSAITGDMDWMQSIDGSYTLLERIQANHSMATGLIPDFIVNIDTMTPDPAPAEWSAPNQDNDGEYFYNAARVPLRLASDYITSSGGAATRAKALLTKIEDWITSKTGGNSAQVVDGYELNGDNLGNGSSFLFESTFGAGAIVDAKYQAWLNTIWGRISVGGVANPTDSATDSIRLLSLIVISGNWWAP